MKSTVLLLLLFVGTSIANQCDGLNFLNNPSHVAVSVAFVSSSGNDATFALQVSNKFAGSGLTNVITSVHGAIFNELAQEISGYNGNMNNVVVGAYTASEFSVSKQKIGQCIAVAVTYVVNGSPRLWLGGFLLDDSVVFNARSIASSVSERDGTVFMPDDGAWYAVGGSQTSNSFPIDNTYTTTVYAVTYSTYDIQGQIIVSYLQTGHSYASIAGSTVKYGSVGFLGNNGNYTMNCTITWKNTPTGSLNYYSRLNPLYVTTTGFKRSVEIDDMEVANQSTIRSDYAIGVAIAGVAVAAVAVVAAVAIVRRKNQVQTGF